MGTRGDAYSLHCCQQIQCGLMRVRERMGGPLANSTERKRSRAKSVEQGGDHVWRLSQNYQFLFSTMVYRALGILQLLLDSFDDSFHGSRPVFTGEFDIAILRRIETASAQQRAIMRDDGAARYRVWTLDWLSEVIPDSFICSNTLTKLRSKLSEEETIVRIVENVGSRSKILQGDLDYPQLFWVYLGTFCDLERMASWLRSVFEPLREDTVHTVIRPLQRRRAAGPLPINANASSRDFLGVALLLHRRHTNERDSASRAPAPGPFEHDFDTHSLLATMERVSKNPYSPLQLRLFQFMRTANLAIYIPSFRSFSDSYLLAVDDKKLVDLGVRERKSRHDLTRFIQTVIKDGIPMMGADREAAEVAVRRPTAQVAKDRELRAVLEEGEIPEDGEIPEGEVAEVRELEAESMQDDELHGAIQEALSCTSSTLLTTTSAACAPKGNPARVLTITGKENTPSTGPGAIRTANSHRHHPYARPH
ncbi:hypothetical protein DFH06DRAFT_529535 [Mycena polygramma]|nr:hypothetical protein DFH06DRAFT_529535 [Mycena polygramma]